MLDAILFPSSPERMIMTIHRGDLRAGADQALPVAEKNADKKSAIKSRVKEQIIGYLTDHATAKASEIAAFIQLKPSRTRDYLQELTAEDIIMAEGEKKARTYQVKT